LSEELTGRVRDEAVSGINPELARRMLEARDVDQRRTGTLFDVLDNRSRLDHDLDLRSGG
jgi:hypothetical protein